MKVPKFNQFIAEAKEEVTNIQVAIITNKITKNPVVFELDRSQPMDRKASG